MIKIVISDNGDATVLETTVENYKEDLAKNKEKINNIWWRLQVEYIDGINSYDYPYNHNHKSPRRVITVNGRNIYAEYNFTIEGKRNDTYDKLMEYLDRDFGTKEQDEELQEIEKEHKKYMRETTKPVNTKIEPKENNLKEELLDD